MELFSYYRCRWAGQLDAEFCRPDTMKRNHEDRNVYDPCIAADIDHHNRK